MTGQEQDIVKSARRAIIVLFVCILILTAVIIAVTVISEQEIRAVRSDLAQSQNDTAFLTSQIDIERKRTETLEAERDLLAVSLERAQERLDRQSWLKQRRPLLVTVRDQRGRKRHTFSLAFDREQVVWPVECGQFSVYVSPNRYGADTGNWGSSR